MGRLKRPERSEPQLRLPRQERGQSAQCKGKWKVGAWDPFLRHLLLKVATQGLPTETFLLSNSGKSVTHSVPSLWGIHTRRK